MNGICLSTLLNIRLSSTDSSIGNSFPIETQITLHLYYTLGIFCSLPINVGWSLSTPSDIKYNVS